jgi:hypothetical protein
MVQRFSKDPWGLICSFTANQPIYTYSSIYCILQLANIVSKRNPSLSTLLVLAEGLHS